MLHPVVTSYTTVTNKQLLGAAIHWPILNLQRTVSKSYGTGSYTHARMYISIWSNRHKTAKRERERKQARNYDRRITKLFVHSVMPCFENSWIFFFTIFYLWSMVHFKISRWFAPSRKNCAEKYAWKFDGKSAQEKAVIAQAQWEKGMGRGRNPRLEVF